MNRYDVAFVVFRAAMCALTASAARDIVAEWDGQRRERMVGRFVLWFMLTLGLLFQGAR